MKVSRSTRNRIRSRPRYSSRPFVVSILLITLLTTYALVIRPRLGIISPRDNVAKLDVRTTQKDTDCRSVHRAVDQCAFILANCEDDEAGLLHYLTFYYCALGNVKPVAFTILAIWLGLLFTTIGIAASDFFSINLSTIAKVLGLSESLAGVTFLAFGNGSPDVFSTFAAMGSNSGSMAVGELIGAAGFITAVVAGSMALVCEFKVSKRTFVRDIVFFIAAISFTVVFLADGELHLWECFTMIGFYLFYVVVVVSWHWFTMRRRRQRQKQAAARTQVQGTGAESEDIEPYRDLPDSDSEAPVGRRSSSAPGPADISGVERGPRIEIDGRGVSTGSTSPDDEDEQRDIHVAAEMTSNMRVNRPRWGRSNTTITPIRPSLVGALEFRSALSSLHKARNMNMGQLPERQYSDHASQLSGALERGRGRPRTNTTPTLPSAVGRDRALSYGNLPLNIGTPIAPLPEIVPEAPSPELGRTTSSTVDGMLAPPSPSAVATDYQSTATSPSRRSERPQLQIPALSRGSSGRSSPALSPFPHFTESPGALTPLPPQDEATAFMFPVPSERRLSAARPLTDDAEQPKPVKWWPYWLLPPPHVLLSTLFPTLQGWKEKAWWDKIVGLISVPSIFCLVTTLPVVETDDQDDDSDDDLEPAEFGLPGQVEYPVDVQRDATLQQETEWQAFRRRTRSVSSRSYHSPSPGMLSVDGHETDGEAASPLGGPRSPLSMSVPPITKANPGPEPPEPDRATASTEESEGWKRWLIVLQLFTGPLFVVLVAWANTYDDMENPRQMLLRLVVYSLMFSFCLLAALLLLTTADKKPKYHFILCFLGFVISIAWISTVAGEVVGVLKAFGVILGISEAILGLTIFAVGNSLGDLVADVTVARLGYPVMALAACFGGPMLNILLGVGIGGAWMGISKANEKHQKHPGKPIFYKPYRIEVGGTLMISAITVLLTLIVLLIVVPSNNWVMSRKIGWSLISIWTISTTINLGVELTGTWSDVS